MTRAQNTDPDHEALCRRCGVSCHAALPVNGLPVVVPGVHCRYLVPEPGGTFACSVYERRLEVAPWCHTADEALAAGLLAQDCPYVRGVAGYRGKARLHPRLLRTVLPAVRRELLERGAPDWVGPEGCVALLEQGGGAFSAVHDAEAGRWRFVSKG
jgi:uncharacterized cysteine cluster protein YcgN (CxxCxxCC family)